MPKKSATARLRNLARGGENYRHLRWRVFSIFAESPDTEIAPLTDYLSGTFFSLISSPQKYDEIAYPLDALPMLERDWKVLQYLSTEKRKPICKAYLELVAQYIRNNRASVRGLIDFEARISRNVLKLDVVKISEDLIRLNATEKQSIFAFKLYCALNADRHETIADYFAKSRHSDWVRQHFLYPLIFYFINVPTKETFDQVLTQTFPNPGQKRSELDLVKLLISEDLDAKVSIAFKCYAALLCHPFDAFHLIVSHFENIISKGGDLDDIELDIARQIYDATSSTRLETVLHLSSKQPWKFSVEPTDLPICSYLGLDQNDTQFFESFVGVRQSAPLEDLSGLFMQLRQLRWSRYPIQADFADVVAIARRYGFCEAGRFLGVLLTSLYMVERRSQQDEVLHLIRQLYFFGAISAFTLCSPRGADALDAGILISSDRYAEIKTDHALSQIVDTSRWWLKRLHWQLRSAQRSMKISEWLHEVRNHIPLSGNSRFLSGIDWAWIDKVIEALRIKPFQGQVDGIYVLLMRAMEQRQREPNSLMLALAPFTPQHDKVSGLVAWLVREYEEYAVAFVRFFLTPSMILKMRLETNYTAALSERLNALEFCAAAFGFNDDVMTAEQFAYEQRTLTSSLTFITVGTAQFELPWDIFAADVSGSVADEYKTYVAVNKTYNALPLLSDARATTSHIYRNKEVRTYEFKNREWPLVVTICSIIDLFLSHPSYGIESILAIRIRHDNLRREFALALAGLRRTKLLDVSTLERDLCLRVLEVQVYSELQSWIDAYMHTRKTKIEQGIFEFLPDQAEMASFVSQFRNTPSLEDVVATIVDWLRRRLDESLHTARSRLVDELQPALQRAISTARQTLGRDDIRPAVIDRVSGTAETLVMRKAEELKSWFETPTGPRKEGLSYFELKMAVEGRFHEEVASGQLVMSLNARKWSNLIVPPEKIRSAFDLWCELTMNALKYSKRDVVKIRVHPFEENAVKGLVFSSLRVGGSNDSERYFAEPTSINEPMLKAGKSGLKIVAALSASILRKPIELRVFERKGSYHVLVPLGQIS